MQSPLPPVLVSILEGALQHGATHAEIETNTVALWCGETRLGVGQLPPDSYAPLVALLRAHADMQQVAQHGHAVFHGPLGSVPVDVEFHDSGVRLVFSTDSGATRAEKTVNLALQEAVEIGADCIVFAPIGVGYFKGSEHVGVARLDSALLPAVIAQAERLAGSPTGGRCLIHFANGRRVALLISIEDRGGEPCAILRFEVSGS